MADPAQARLGAIQAQPNRRTGADERGGAALVSVVIPCYNQAHFLGEAIESVLAQTYPHLEIVVVGRDSTDNTAAVAGRYPGVRYVRQADLGVAAARNTGRRHSSGSYLVFLDADDRLLPRAVEVGLRQLQAHPECAFAFGKWRPIAVDGSPLSKLPPPGDEIDGDSYVRLLQRNHIEMLATVLYRRGVFDAVGGFDPSSQPSEDYDLFLRIARQYPICSHGAIVAEYRRHGSNTSNDPARMLRGAVMVLRRQLRYVQGDAERTAAYRAGLRTWYGFYGRLLAAEVVAQAAAGERRRALRGLAALIRELAVSLRNPVLLASAALPVLWRQWRPMKDHLQGYARDLGSIRRGLRLESEIGCQDDSKSSATYDA